jgi:hypothetical protein
MPSRDALFRTSFQYSLLVDVKVENPLANQKMQVPYTDPKRQGQSSGYTVARVPAVRFKYGP